MSTTDIGSRQKDWTSEILVLQSYWNKHIPGIGSPPVEIVSKWLRDNTLEGVLYGIQETARKQQKKQWRGLSFNLDHAVRFAGHCIRDYGDRVKKGEPKLVSAYNPALSAPFMKVAA